VRRHTEEVVACVFVVSTGMRSTCAECRSLCLLSLEHLSREVCDGDQTLPQRVSGSVRVHWVVNEMLRANQDGFLECFLQKLADAKHALSLKGARTRLVVKVDINGQDSVSQSMRRRQ
jgi:hypothetical protein